MRKTLSTLLIAITAVFSFSQQDDVVSEEMRVNLVELEVKVTDLNARVVSGLGPEDFVVKENGKRQEIDSFEEIDLGNLPAEEAQEYRSRIMVLLDMRNTSFPIMKRVFPQLREFVQTSYDGKTELGLAVNTGGIVEMLGFTNDQDAIFDAIDQAEAFYKKNKFRSYRLQENLPYTGYYPGYYDAYTPRLGANPTDAYRSRLRNYYRSEMDVLGQFVRYLGAFSGKKNLLLVSERWFLPAGVDTEGSVDREGVISLRDIQTVCMYNKISINVISLTRGSTRQGLPISYEDYYVGNYGNPRNLAQRGRFLIDESASLAAATSGFLFQASTQQVSRFVKRAIDKNQRYYRIRYYSQLDNDRFRSVKVNAKGFNRIAYNLDGYFPKDNEVGKLRAKASLTAVTAQEYDLKMNANWMQWQWAGWGKRRANYVIAHRAYDDEGQIMAEQVTAGQALKLKKRMFTLERRLRLPLPRGARPARVEVIVTDLTSGKQVTFDEIRGDLI